MNVLHLHLGISDAALMASSDGAYGEVELRPSRKFADSRLSALVAAARAEMIAGFPSGRLFLDSVEQGDGGSSGQGSCSKASSFAGIPRRTRLISLAKD